MGDLCPSRDQPFVMSVTDEILIADVDRLFDRQLACWPEAARNYEALHSVCSKSIDLGQMTVKAQYNPARAVSTGARIDAASLAARPCFLCADNRPKCQIGLDWRDYTVLVNPFPIFPRHMTIAADRHTPQTIAGRMADMFDLARALTGYTVFYNGPRCGASAPDHMHFQAGNSDFLPLGKIVADADRRLIASSDDSTLSLVDDLPLKFFVIDSSSAEGGAAMMGRLLSAMPVADGDTEPMVNILAFSLPDEGIVRAVVIPRKRHRPSFYGDGSGDTMMISPASVDLAGVFITPLRCDYGRLDAQIVKSLYNELIPNNLNQISSYVK